MNDTWYFKPYGFLVIVGFHADYEWTNPENLILVKMRNIWLENSIKYVTFDWLSWVLFLHGLHGLFSLFSSVPQWGMICVFLVYSSCSEEAPGAALFF